MRALKRAIALGLAACALGQQANAQLNPQFGVVKLPNATADGTWPDFRDPARTKKLKPFLPLADLYHPTVVGYFKSGAAKEISPGNQASISFAPGKIGTKEGRQLIEPGARLTVDLKGQPFYFHDYAMVECIAKTDYFLATRWRVRQTAFSGRTQLSVREQTGNSQKGFSSIYAWTPDVASPGTDHIRFEFTIDEAPPALQPPFFPLSGCRAIRFGRI